MYIKTVGCGKGHNSLDLMAVWNLLNNWVLDETWVMNVKMTVFWDVTLGNLVDID